MRIRSVLMLAGLAALGARAADPPRPAFPDAVRHAVASRLIQDSDNLGNRSARAPYREVITDGGVLVGLEVAIGKVADNDVPVAYRPIYRAGAREWTGRPAGNLRSRRVRRVVTVVARDQYAVGGIWVRAGAGIDRLCLNFFRIRGGGLDPNDSYVSEWVGNSDGGTERYLNGRGRPVVGLFADATAEQVRNLGLVFARVPPAPRKVDGPNADTPAPPPSEPKDGPSKLELEAVSSRTSQEQPQPASDWTSRMPYVLAGVIALPLALIGAVVLARKGNRGLSTDDDQAGQPLHELDGQPLSERPTLARRVDPYLPAARARKRRRPVNLQEDPASPSSEVPPRPPKDAPRPILAASQPVVALPTPPPDDLPPFFVVRATDRAGLNRMTRVYVLEDELLILDEGPGADVNQAAVAIAGGGTMAEGGQKSHGGQLQQQLDSLDVGGLLQAAADAGNMRARFEDLVGLAVDPPPAPSFWREKTGALGTFRFRHLERGEFTFEFLSGTEIRGAIEMIRHSAAADRLLVGEGWDEVTASYLAGV
jgi:hypothetical protein